MSRRRTAKEAPASIEAKRKSLAEWQRLMTRYPMNSAWSVVFSILATLGANVLTAWLLLSGQMTPLELVVLVGLEAVLLTAITWLQRFCVPPSAIEKVSTGKRRYLVQLGFGLFWLCAAYSIVFLGMLSAGDQVLAAARDPFGFLARSTLKWPLLITLLVAIIDAFNDVLHLRRYGGTLISTPGFSAAGRWLTLFLGGIPMFVPFAGIIMGLVYVGKQAVSYWKKRFGEPSERMMILGMFMIPIGGWLVLTLIETLLSSLEPYIEGVGWWAMCYVSAKFVSELFVACIPLIARKAHAEETAALQGSASAG